MDNVAHAMVATFENGGEVKGGIPKEVLVFISKSV
jgi:hypothetical protein